MASRRLLFNQGGNCAHLPDVLNSYKRMNHTYLSSAILREVTSTAFPKKGDSEQFLGLQKLLTVPFFGTGTEVL